MSLKVLSIKSTGTIEIVCDDFEEVIQTDSPYLSSELVDLLEQHIDKMQQSGTSTDHYEKDAIRCFNHKVIGSEVFALETIELPFFDQLIETVKQNKQAELAAEAAALEAALTQSA